MACRSASSAKPIGLRPSGWGVVVPDTIAIAAWETRNALRSPDKVRVYALETLAKPL